MSFAVPSCVLALSELSTRVLSSLLGGVELRQDSIQAVVCLPLTTSLQDAAKKNRRNRQNFKNAEFDEENTLTEFKVAAKVCAEQRG